MRRVILLFIILLLLCTPAYARVLTVSNGIALENTKENATPIEKPIISDLKNAPVDLKDIGEEGYSLTPVSDVLVTKENSVDRAEYKSQYIAKYSDLIGTHTVYLEKDVIDIRIYDVAYLSNGLLQFNISAYVNGVEKKIRNPYKIYNPPMLVQVSQDVKISDTESIRGDLVEDPDSAVLESIAYTVKIIENGKATFSDGDPTLTVYASNVTIHTRAAAAGGESVLVTAEGAGSAASQLVSTSPTDAAGIVVSNTTKTVNYLSSMIRSGYFFNATSIGSSSIINFASINLYGASKSNTFAVNGSSMVTRYSPAGNIIGATADYQQMNNTFISNNISYSSYTTSGYNNYTLTSQGYYGIDRVINSTFALRTNVDMDKTWNGTWSNFTTSIYGYYIYGPEYTGTSRDPYLVVIYVPSVAPVASFTFTPSSSHTLPATVSFTDTSTNIPDAWTWYFGDGGTSTLQNPTHVYNTSGIFTPILIASNLVGSDSETCTSCISMSNDIPYNSTQSGQPIIDIPNTTAFKAWAPQLLNKSNSDFPIIGFAYSLGLPFTNAMGEVSGDDSGWLFYYILWGILLIMIYRSSGSGVLAGLFGIVSGGAMSLLVGGEVIVIATIFVIAIITGAIFTWGTKED